MDEVIRRYRRRRLSLHLTRALAGKRRRPGDWIPTTAEEAESDALAYLTDPRDTVEYATVWADGVGFVRCWRRDRI